MMTINTTWDGKSNMMRWVGWEAEEARTTAKTMTIYKTEATTTTAAAAAVIGINPLHFFPIQIRLDKCVFNALLFCCSLLDSFPELSFSTFSFGEPVSPRFLSTKSFTPWSCIMIFSTLRKRSHVLVSFCSSTLRHPFLMDRARASFCLMLRR